MKKIYSLITLCLSTTFVMSQFNVGQKVLGGSIGFNNSKVGDSSYNYNTSNNLAFNFSPSIGWFTKTNKLSGVAFSYGYNRNKSAIASNNTTDINQSNSIGLKYFSQRFFSLSQNLFFTVNASVGGSYSFGENKTNTNNIESKVKTKGYGISAEIAPGLSYRLTQRFLFDAYLSNLLNINYYNQSQKNPSTGEAINVQKGFGFSTSLSNTNIGNVGLGFRWLLKK